jgi:predicted methyltransferase
MADRQSLTTRAHRAVAEVVRPGDTVIDATAGNGHDTCFLAGLVGPTGKVYAFDVQPEAIEATRQRLEAAGLAAQARLLDSGHERMDAALPMALKGRISAIMFNLGYLPGGDKTIVTRPSSTTRALELATEWLKPGGILTVMAYPGHDGGAKELEAVRLGLADARRLHTEFLRGPPGTRPSPVLFVARHLRDTC